MKIAVTTAGAGLEDPVDPRFGRAPRFLIFDTVAGTIHLRDNKQNLNAAQGAGIQSARTLCEEQVDCVITGNCGPKAFTTLKAANISVYLYKNGTIGEAIELLKRGKLELAQDANVEGHWI